MKNNRIIYSGLLIVLIVSISCNKKETASEILQKTINAINTIETIYYKQDMERTNPRNINDTIIRYREMYFKRLISDSIVGVKGHWYMYINDKENVIYEDIFDGNRLIRKNNRDSVARIYDLVKYPDFKRKHFWSHNTPYGMQYEFKYMLNNRDFYTIERLSDTVVDGKNCYRIGIQLKDKMTMPGFEIKLEDNKGSVSSTIYCIDKKTYYPIRMRGEFYSIDNQESKAFIDQRYYDIKFNLAIDEDVQFNTTDKSITGFDITDMRPD